MYFSQDMLCAEVIRNHRTEFGRVTPFENVIRTISCDKRFSFWLYIFNFSGVCINNNNLVPTQSRMREESDFGDLGD